MLETFHANVNFGQQSISAIICKKHEALQRYDAECEKSITQMRNYSNTMSTKSSVIYCKCNNKEDFLKLILMCFWVRNPILPLFLR